jgi:hypothetical protein
MSRLNVNSLPPTRLRWINANGIELQRIYPLRQRGWPSSMTKQGWRVSFSLCCYFLFMTEGSLHDRGSVPRLLLWLSPSFGITLSLIAGFLCPIQAFVSWLVSVPHTPTASLFWSLNRGLLRRVSNFPTWITALKPINSTPQSWMNHPRHQEVLVFVSGSSKWISSSA